MRTIIKLAQDWLFKKDEPSAQSALPQDWERVAVPHTGTRWMDRTAATTISAASAAMRGAS